MEERKENRKRRTGESNRDSVEEGRFVLMVSEQSMILLEVSTELADTESLFRNESVGKQTTRFFGRMLGKLLYSTPFESPRRKSA